MPKLSVQETHTILAALRYMQFNIKIGDEIPDEIQTLATDGGTSEPLSMEQIDELCQRLNFDDSEALQTEAVGLLAECAGYLASARTDLKRTIAGDVFALQRMEWAEGAKEFAAKANVLLEKIDDAK